MRRPESIPVVLFTVLVLSLTSAGALAADCGAKSVLLLHSYHDGFRWTESIEAGIREAFGESGQAVCLSVENLDTKRHRAEVVFGPMARLLAAKYEFDAVDLIMVTDDNALSFMLGPGRDIFPDTPVVFSGVNDAGIVAGIEGLPITGAMEDIDMAGTLETALALHPGTRTVVAVTDDTFTGASLLKRFRRTMAEVAPRLRLVQLAGQPPAQLQAMLEGLGPGTLVFRLSYFTDRSGATYSEQDSYSRVAQASPWPVYTFWSTGVGLGTVGGKVPDGHHEGRAAAAMALRILDGEDPASIPVREKSDNIFIFDHAQLERFGIGPEILPPDSVVLNQPATVYERYSRIIWTGTFVIVALGVVILLLSWNISRRRKAERQLMRYSQNLVDMVRDRTRELNMMNDRLQEIVEGTIDGLVVLDREGRIGFANTRAAQMLVREGESPLGHELGMPSIEDGSEVDLVGRDGRPVIAEMRRSEVEWDGVSATLVILRDVTDRSRAVEQLRQAHRLLNAHIENSPLAVVEWAPDLCVTRWSQRAEALFGRSAGEIEGICAEEAGLVQGRDMDVFLSGFNRLVEGREPRNLIEVRSLGHDGRVLYCEWQNSALFDEYGQLISIFSQVHDITEQREAEAELHQAKNELELRVLERTRELEDALAHAQDAHDKIDTILRSVADGLVVTDPENRVVLMNPVAEDILGLSMQEVRGKRIGYCIQDRTLRDSFARNIERARRLASYQFEFHVDDETMGIGRYIRARTSVIMHREEGPSGIVISMRDMTREHEVDRMKTDFISTAAHELRTPLTSIQGFAELLLVNEESLEDFRRHRYINYIHRQSLSLAGIISDLLDISRIESGQGFTLDRREVDAVAVVEEKIRAWREQYPDFDFEIDSPDGTLPLQADRGKLDQLMENLLSNAVKYSPRGSRVDVRLRPRGESVEVEVVDQGQGMEPEQARRIFEKFYRGHAASGAIPGTGLGMAIVKHIIQAHGGSIDVRSAKGEGTSVIFRLPVDGYGPAGSRSPRFPLPTGEPQIENGKEMNA